MAGGLGVRSKERRKEGGKTNSVLMSESQLWMPGAQSYWRILWNPEECALRACHSAGGMGKHLPTNSISPCMHAC